MFSFKMLLCAAALTLLAAVVESSSSSGGTPNYNYDLSGSDLTSLFNSPVFEAERVKRPLDGTTTELGPLSHSGVRVTLADDSQWLIHLGKNYGISSDTVVTSARHMSPNWRVVDTVDFNGRKTVSDLVAAGGSDYNFFTNNCHLGSRRIMRQ
ncbi:uncharacterized protein [Pempheris klunzingeri]|uniref:uncharacterized protein n=1 Tax=Pempheris klunzingeri TaxID=3127111 RepID=UPI0039802B17